MKTKLVKRFWCDHCNKAGLQAHSMAKHEMHCTMNPTRKCRVCIIIEGASDKTVAELMEVLPVPVVPKWGYGKWECDAQPEYYAYLDAAKAALPALREASGDCPACILAAIRQRGIPVPIMEGFDFTAEMRAIFNDRNHEFPY